MPKLNHANHFNSDRIAVKLGIAEHWPNELGTSDAQHIRLSLAVNTHYPEISGGYYVNARVLSVVAASLKQQSLFLVNEEYYSDINTLPIEQLQSVENDQRHLVFDVDGNRLGSVVQWQFDTGGGGDFFADNMIIDFCIEKAMADNLIDVLRAYCASGGVRLVE